MNEQSHWDKIAPSYNEEIFDVFNSDKDRRLQYYFKKYSNPKHRAIDFGCGTGKALPYLAPAFRTVLGVDISAECIRQAKGRPFTNTSFKRMDLSGRNVKLAPADFVFCCNVIMLPEVEKNIRMFKNLRQSMKKKGHALIVVPSTDSMLFAAWRMIDWYKKEGVSPEEIPAWELAYFSGRKIDILQGIIRIDGVPTKHYLATELEVLLKEAGLTIDAMERLNYEWTSEFASPPAWMKDPYPWDWLIACTG